MRRMIEHGDTLDIEISSSQVRNMRYSGLISYRVELNGTCNYYGV